MYTSCDRVERIKSKFVVTILLTMYKYWIDCNKLDSSKDVELSKDLVIHPVGW
jgi:hypothetical protein